MGPGSAQPPSLAVEPAFLDALPEADRRGLVDLGTRVAFRRGDVIFREDDDSARVLMLLKGRVKISTTARSGREVILQVYDEGALLGELAALDGDTRSATVTALTALEAIAVKPLDFVDFVEHHPATAMVLVRLLAAKLRRAAQHQLSIGTADATGRLCAALLTLADRYAQDDGSTVFEMPFTQQDLASLAGTSREAIVKGLGQLRSLGWIETTGKSVTLLDVDALSRHASQ